MVALSYAGKPLARDHGGVGGAGRDRDDPRAALAERLGLALDQFHDAVLGQRIGGDPVRADLRERRDVAVDLHRVRRRSRLGRHREVGFDVDPQRRAFGAGAGQPVEDGICVVY